MVGSNRATVAPSRLFCAAELGDAHDAFGRPAGVGQDVDRSDPPRSRSCPPSAGRWPPRPLVAEPGRSRCGTGSARVRVPAVADGGRAPLRVADGLAVVVDDLGVARRAADGVGHAGRRRTVRDRASRGPRPASPVRRRASRSSWSSGPRRRCPGRRWRRGSSKVCWIVSLSTSVPDMKATPSVMASALATQAELVGQQAADGGAQHVRPPRPGASSARAPARGSDRQEA